MSGMALVVDVRANLAELKAKMQEAENYIGTTSAAMKSMGNAFDNTQTIARANAAINVVKDMAGVAQLTEAQQKRLNDTLTKALEEYALLGTKAPTVMQEMAEATKNAGRQVETTTQKTSLMGDVFARVGPQLAAAFSIGAITAWVSKTIDAGSQIEDLSRKLEVSHEAIQRWGYAAELSGGSIEDVSQAIGFMNKTLGGGSDGTIAALRQAGLEFDAIRAMNPEQAFDAITEAIKNIPDPMTQSRVAMELFGKGAASLLPAIRDGFREVGAEASVMSDATIAALDRAGDAWTRLKNRVVIASGSLIASIEETILPLGEHRDIYEAIDKESAKLSTSLDRVGAAALASAGVNKGKLVPSLNDADKALAAFNAQYGDNEKKILANADAVTAHAKAIQALGDHITGADVIGKAKLLDEWFRKSGEGANLNANQIAGLFKETDALAKGPLGSSALPARLREFWMETGKAALSIGIDLNPKIDDLNDKLHGMTPELKAAIEGVALFIKKNVENAKAANAELEADSITKARAIVSEHDKADRAIEQRHAQFVATIEGYSVTLIDGMIHGWDAFKQSAKRILDDILGYFEHAFVKGLIGQIMGVENAWGAAFSGIASKGASTYAGIASQAGATATASEAAATASTAAWAGSFAAAAASSISWAATAYMAWEWYRTLTSDHHTPMPPGAGPAPDIPNNPERGGSQWNEGLSYAQMLFDQATSTGWAYGSDAFYSYMDKHPEFWGQGRGFRGGTHGEYVDFGAGTPVMLHGKERVVTEAEGRRESSGGGTMQIVFYMDGRDVARAAVPFIPGEKARIGIRA